MEALISRTAFYDLVSLAEETLRDNQVHLSITSLGQAFDLGRVDMPEIQ